MFPYRQQSLHVEDVSLATLAEKVRTPFYCYSSGYMTQQYQQLAQALQRFSPLICFAVKANSNQAVIKTFGQLGAGADVVSGGELRRALAVGIPASKIVFSGVGKTAEEITFALQQNIFQFNIESEPELMLVAQLAEKIGKKAAICLRVNPDVDAQTHAKISTGKAENKFGIDRQHIMALYQAAQHLPGLNVVGLAVHIGSQITDFSAFGKAFASISQLVAELRQKNLPVNRIDVGGGIGIPYRGETPPSLASYAALIEKWIAPLNCQLLVEPGRYLVGNGGILVSRVLYVKKGKTRQFLIIDAAMNDLLRPSLYEAWHEFQLVQQPQENQPRQLYDIVGPVCETGDTFASQRPLPPVQPGDLVAILSAGAYGAAMASTYNSRLLAPEILVKGNQFKIVRPRLNYDTLLGYDQLPDWLR